MAEFMYQPTAPGRDAPGTVATQPVDAAPPAGSEAPPPPSKGFDPTMILLLLAPLLLFFFMSRSQTKKQKEVEASLKVGEKVVLRSGMIGKLVDVGERYSKVEIAPGVNVQVLKSTIEGKDVPPDTKAADAKAADAKDAKDAKPSDSKAKDSAKEPAKDKAQDKKA